MIFTVLVKLMEKKKEQRNQYPKLWDIGTTDFGTLQQECYRKVYSSSSYFFSKEAVQFSCIALVITARLCVYVCMFYPYTYVLAYCYQTAIAVWYSLAILI